MAKASYSGGGTIIGPQDVTWFGTGGVKGGPRDDAGQVAQRQSHPLNADAERRIGNLRVDIAGLKGQLARLDQNRATVAEHSSDRSVNWPRCLSGTDCRSIRSYATLLPTPSGSGRLSTRRRGNSAAGEQEKL